jgi:hypothetical protein
MLAHGPIPLGHFVCHHCDNPRCIRTLHLFLGTPADNTRDMDNKGRRRMPHGEEHGRAKLSADQVREIRARKGQATIVALGKEFGVTFGQISRIQLGKAWRHEP